MVSQIADLFLFRDCILNMTLLHRNESDGSVKRPGIIDRLIPSFRTSNLLFEILRKRMWKAYYVFIGD